SVLSAGVETVGATSADVVSAGVETAGVASAGVRPVASGGGSAGFTGWGDRPPVTVLLFGTVRA
ncbi:hypothetical protein, partial [Streptosporangium sp. NPDC048865]|uniref:hypothetical protein n=1 Tax=Streptosporangium sp. NPDC048865 TaxID=3155766 RepID=UPI00343744C0